MKMTAAVLGGVGQKLQIDEVEIAPPRDGEVLVKIAASGLCASDLNAIDGKRTLAPFPLVPFPEEPPHPKTVPVRRQATLPRRTPP